MTPRPVKRAVVASAVKLLFHARDDRGMQLCDLATRCLARHEVHEVVTTDQREARAGDRIDRVGFLAFAEVETGGVVERGDRLVVAGRDVGVVLGFDGCHAPNHWNVLVGVPELLTADSLDLRVGDELRFEPGEPAPEQGRRLAATAAGR